MANPEYLPITWEGINDTLLQSFAYLAGGHLLELVPDGAKSLMVHCWCETFRVISPDAAGQRLKASITKYLQQNSHPSAPGIRRITTGFKLTDLGLPAIKAACDAILVVKVPWKGTTIYKTWGNLEDAVVDVEDLALWEPLSSAAVQTSDQGAAVGRGWKLQAIIIWIAVYRAVSLIGVRDDLDDSWFNIVDCFVPTFLGALMRIKGVASLVSQGVLPDAERYITLKAMINRSLPEDPGQLTDQAAEMMDAADEELLRLSAKVFMFKTATFATRRAQRSLGRKLVRGYEKVIKEIEDAKKKESAAAHKLSLLQAAAEQDKTEWESQLQAGAQGMPIHPEQLPPGDISASLFLCAVTPARLRLESAAAGAEVAGGVVGTGGHVGSAAGAASSQQQQQAGMVGHGGLGPRVGGAASSSLVQRGQVGAAVGSSGVVQGGPGFGGQAVGDVVGLSGIAPGLLGGQMAGAVVLQRQVLPRASAQQMPRHLGLQQAPQQLLSLQQAPQQLLSLQQVPQQLLSLQQAPQQQLGLQQVLQQQVPQQQVLQQQVGQQQVQQQQGGQGDRAGTGGSIAGHKRAREEESEQEPLTERGWSAYQ